VGQPADGDSPAKLGDCVGVGPVSVRELICTRIVQKVRSLM